MVGGGITAFFGGFVHRPLLEFRDLGTVVFLVFAKVRLGFITIVGAGVEKLGVDFGEFKGELRGFDEGEH